MVEELRHWIVAFFAIIGGGLGVAFLQRNKTEAEAASGVAGASLAKAQADEFSWQHMLEIVHRLEKDVAGLLDGRTTRDKQIATLEKRSDDCERREKKLIERVSTLEKAGEKA